MSNLDYCNLVDGLTRVGGSIGMKNKFRSNIFSRLGNGMGVNSKQSHFSKTNDTKHHWSIDHKMRRFLILRIGIHTRPKGEYLKTRKKDGIRIEIIQIWRITFLKLRNWIPKSRET